MRFPSSKRAAKVCLLALFLTCLGLFVAVGQVSAAPANSSWQGSSCHKQDDHNHWKCHDSRHNYDRNYNCNNSDSDSDDWNSNFCENSYNYNTCNEWDSYNGDCMLWVTGSYYNNAYNYNYPYGNIAQSGCDQWDPHTGLCVHWQVNYAPGYGPSNN